MRIVVVTGLSGAGKSTALRALEDLGFYCVDNLPLPLVPSFIDELSGRGHDMAAFSVDARQHEFLDAYEATVVTLGESGHSLEVLFLEADDTTLLRRFSATRRRHPLAGDELADGIRRDREVLAILRENASVLNTGSLTVHELKAMIAQRFGKEAGSLSITLQSFGFKYGLPADSDLVFDVRFLANPYFVPELREHDGRDPAVSEYVLSQPDANSLLEHIDNYLSFAVPKFAAEGKLYLTVAIGCTGGQHRSVAIAESLRGRLAEAWGVAVRHRDVNRGK